MSKQSGKRNTPSVFSTGGIFSTGVDALGLKVEGVAVMTQDGDVAGFIIINGGGAYLIPCIGITRIDGLHDGAFAEAASAVLMAQPLVKHAMENL